MSADPPRDPATISVPDRFGMVIADAVEFLIDGEPAAIGDVDMNRVAAAADVLFGDPRGGGTAMFGVLHITLEVADLQACRAVLGKVAQIIRADPGEDKDAAAEAIAILHRARAQLRRPAAEERPATVVEQRLELIAMLVDLWRDGAAGRFDGENAVLMMMLRAIQLPDAEVADMRAVVIAALGDPDEDDDAPGDVAVLGTAAGP